VHECKFYWYKEPEREKAQAKEKFEFGENLIKWLRIKNQLFICIQSTDQDGTDQSHR